MRIIFFIFILSMSLYSNDSTKVKSDTTKIITDTLNMTPSPNMEVIKAKTKAVESKSSTSQQCNGTTKKGKQCSRTTTSSNGYCWQHGGN